MLTAFSQSQCSGSSTSTGQSQVVTANDQTSSAGDKPLVVQSNEGFWGHLNPFARKKWVNRQLDPVKDRLNELDELSAKNARDIKAVDERSQAGIRQAQNTADQASQQATNANSTATQAQEVARQSQARTQQLGTTVANLDQYQPVSDTEIRFRPGQRVLNVKAKDALDGIATQLQGQKGYLIEVQGYSPIRGEAGVQNSQKLADSVVRYFVEQHQVPIYRIHVVGMGNAAAQSSDGTTSGGSVVHVTLVQNSLAALNTTGGSGGSPIGATQQQMSVPSPGNAASAPAAKQ